MLDTFKAVPCAGVAAYQIGFDKRIFIGLKHDDYDDGQDEEAVVSILNEYVSVMRKTLASRLELKRVPELDFYYDSSVQRGARLSKIIDGIVEPTDAVDER